MAISHSLSLLLLMRCSMATGWTMPHRQSQLAAGLHPMPTALGSGGPFFEEEYEFECPDKDECEIDWSKAPAKADTIGSSSSIPEPEDSDDECDDEEGCEIDWDAMPDFDEDEAETAKPSSFANQVQQSLNSKKGRVRLEMNWQIDECQTDEDSCEGFCEECSGSGKMPCRFCRGTKIAAYGDDYRTCIVCAEGSEDCSACRGTGKIAPWTTTYLEGNSSSQ
eukprot:scaffold1184_cov132-Cylindrotheca_fusiformis.AAC.2